MRGGVHDMWFGRGLGGSVSGHMVVICRLPSCYMCGWKKQVAKKVEKVRMKVWKFTSKKR